METKEKKIKSCGSCLHLEKEKAFEQPCKFLGKLATSKPCGTYKPNIHMLVRDEDTFNRLQMIAEAIDGLDNHTLEALSRTLDTVRKTKKNGYKFWQPVYVRYLGTGNANYLSNFMKCRVLQADKEWVRLISENGKTFLTLINDSTTLIMSTKEFVQMRKKMRLEGKFVDPKAVDLCKTSAAGDVAEMDEVIKKGTMSKTIKRGIRASREDSNAANISRIVRGKGGKRKQERSGEVSF